MTRSRKRDQVPQKFEIALLLLAHCALYFEWNGTKIAAIRVFVVELWLYPFQQPQNVRFEKTRPEIRSSMFPYTSAVSLYVYFHVIIGHAQPRGRVAHCCFGG